MSQNQSHSHSQSQEKEQKKSIFLITGNKNKLLEFQQILGDQFDLQNQNIDLPELQGTAEDISKQKALIAFQSVKRPVIVEDTSLCFNAYKGLPGPYIKWFLESLGTENLPKMLDGFQDKSGYAQCIISYMREGLSEPILFVGRTPGTIVPPKQIPGEKAFGWDPNFLPDGYDKTYAQLPKEEKNKISHRFRAIEEMVKYFDKNN